MSLQASHEYLWTLPLSLCLDWTVLPTNKTGQQRKQSAVLRASASSPQTTIRVNTCTMHGEPCTSEPLARHTRDGPYKLHSIQDCLPSLRFPLWDEDGWLRSRQPSQRQTATAPSPIQLPALCSLTQTTHILALPHQGVQRMRSRNTMRKDTCLYSGCSWRTCKKKQAGRVACTHRMSTENIKCSLQQPSLLQPFV